MSYASGGVVAPASDSVKKPSTALPACTVAMATPFCARAAGAADDKKLHDDAPGDCALAAPQA